MTAAETDTHSSGAPQGDRDRGNRGASPSRRCQFCYRPLRLARVGDWYHLHNASVFCVLGGNGRRALPL